MAIGAVPVAGSVPIPRVAAPITLGEIYEGGDLPRVSEPDMLDYDVEMAELEE